MRLRRQYGGAVKSSGGATADLFGWFILAGLWDRLDDPVRITAAVMLVVIPLAIASALVYRCTAWRVTEHTRCEQRRPGLFRRCADHAGQVVTVHDVAAVLCVVIGVGIGVAALMQ